jgi:carboxyl-terminal processing protease
MFKLKNISRRSRVWMLVFALIGSAVISFSFVDNYFEISKNLDIYANLMKELDLYYVDEIHPGDLMKKSMDAMLESLDPYTNYIPESDVEDYKYMMTGQYGGIGALIRQHGDKVMVDEPYEGFPAQKSDLRAGDVIMEVNSVNVRGMKSDQVRKLLIGSPNTPAKITLERDGEKKLLEKNVIREEIKIPSVSYSGMITDHVGLIKLTGFTEGAGMEVKDALSELKKNPQFKFLVFDLRDNPGGLLKEAVDIVNLFVDKGQDIVSTRGKLKDWDKTLKAGNIPVDTITPMVVLVNHGSASASEIVSGALQDLDRAVIIGQRSFGKGLVQQTMPLSYNAQLKVTVAKYYIPSGRCIQALNYSHRNKDGSVDNIPDSLIRAFRTVKNHRIVYDGAGITPDVVMESQVFSNIAVSLISKSYIFDYATQYHISHPSIPAAKDFKLSDADYDEFIAYLKDKKYDYTTNSEKLMDDLKKAAEEEKNYESAKPEFDALKVKMAHNKNEDLLKNKDEIRSLLEEEIASRYYFQKGRLESYVRSDTEVVEALKVLNDSRRYKSILTTIEKPTHPFQTELSRVNDKVSDGQN